MLLCLTLSFRSRSRLWIISSRINHINYLGFLPGMPREKYGGIQTTHFLKTKNNGSLLRASTVSQLGVLTYNISRKEIYRDVLRGNVYDGMCSNLNWNSHKRIILKLSCDKMWNVKRCFVVKKFRNIRICMLKNIIQLCQMYICHTIKKLMV